MTDDVKVFRLAAENGRWIFVVLGLVNNICLGSIYSWSVFRKSLEQLARATSSVATFAPSTRPQH